MTVSEAQNGEIVLKKIIESLACKIRPLVTEGSEHDDGRRFGEVCDQLQSAFALFKMGSSATRAAIYALPSQEKLSSTKPYRHVVD